MMTTWDDDFEESKQEIQSNEEDTSQEIKTFMTHGSSLSSSNDQDDTSSEGEGEEGVKTFKVHLIASTFKVLR